MLFKNTQASLYIFNKATLKYSSINANDQKKGSNFIAFLFGLLLCGRQAGN
jgi:hypothetical protein